MKFLLASTSPRRKELLKTIIDKFEIASPHFDEESVKIKNPTSLVKKLAYEKANAVFEKAKGDWCVIGSDTVVVLGCEIIGKPKDERDAKRILQNLSGKCHKVITGTCLLIRQNEIETKIVFAGISQVYFADLSEKDIDAYIKTGEPLDKAGAYAIQGFGGKFVKKISGSFHEIMGLATPKIYECLKEEGLI